MTLALLLPWAVAAAEPKQTECVLPSFTFHTGETLTNLRLHVTTLGEPTGEPVLVLHGTSGTGNGLLTPQFGGALFGPDESLDAARYYVILPDALGSGKSAKPSDRLHAAFPHYDYADVVLAQYRLVTECLGVRHLRLVLGYSMGGMNTWMWGVSYPGMADAIVPIASQPAAMSGRNWIMRRALIEAIRQDPAYRNGAYTVQPSSLRLANVMFSFSTSGGTLAYQSQNPTTAQADAAVLAALAAPPPADANDYIWQVDASRNYDPAPNLDRIRAAVLAINSADDERNPPETGVMERGLARIPGAQMLLIPATVDTRGHGTGLIARLWATQFTAFMAGLKAPTVPAVQSGFSAGGVQPTGG